MTLGSAAPAGSASTPETTAEVAGRLRLAVARLHRILRQQADLGLTPTKLAHLATINREGPLPLGDLAALERVAPPTVTKVVKGLEAQGLVRREADPADKRVTLVRVTDEGRRTIAAIRDRKDLWLATRLEELEPADLARLAAALDVLEELSAAQPR